MRPAFHETSRRRILRLLAAAGLTVAGPRASVASIERLFAPAKSLDAHWTAHDDKASAQVDHASFDNFLRRYAARDRAGVVRVGYGNVTASDRQALRSYVQSLAAVPVRRLARAEQLAYWINLYNALTLGVVLDHYPVASVRDIDISPGLLARGPWDKALVAVEGHELTLNDIEHRILRPIWSDPRIHYAVNCASVGCPNLRENAFTASTAPRQLDEGARDYVNDPRGVLIAADGVHASSIYDWFQEDFGGSEAGVLAHLARYAGDALAARLAEINSIAGYSYDWSLNDSRGAAR
jgi:hypothetical protein